MDRISHYRIVKPLGAGGMGEVWRAVDERLGRDVAIKLLGRRATADRARRMMREAQAASALNHPSIVTIHDVGEYEGQPYLVMELVAGKRFSELGRVAPPEALRLCALAADALGAAHACGILHRDIKSDNLMRLPDGRVKVLDFGLAKVTNATGALAISAVRPPVPAVSPTAMTRDSKRPSIPPDVRGFAPTIDSSDAAIDAWGKTPLPLPAPGLFDGETLDTSQHGGGLTQIGDILGTPAYMAPEQANGDPVDARSEVFSLGVVLYELVCGRRPFLANDTDTMLETVRRAEVTPPSLATGDPTLARLDAVLATCLAREPSARPADMAAMAALLRRTAEPERRPRRAWLVGSGVAVLAAAALGAGMIAGRSSSSEQPVQPQPAASASHVAAPEISDAERLTLEADCEEFPTISPTGVVVFDAAHGPDYVIEEIDATRRRRALTSGGGMDIAPALSPDGKQLAFLRKRGGPYHAMVGDAELVGPLRELAEGGMRPSWSPDGKALWAGSGRRPTRWNLATGKPERTLAVPEGFVALAPLELADGSVAALMLKPDGGAFPEGVALFDRAGEMHWLYRGEVDEVLARLPGDAAVVISRVVATKRELALLPIAGGKPLPLHAPSVDAHKGLAATPDWSIAVWSDCAEHIELVVVHGDNYAPISAGAWADAELVPVPGTRNLVVISDRSGSVRPWLVDRDGAAPARMIVDAEPQQLDVTADGKTLIYSTGEGELWSAAIDQTGTPNKLAALDNLDFPRVAPGGLVYVQAAGAIYTVPLAGGTPHRVLAGVAPAPSPVAGTIVYARGDDADRTLVVRTLATGAEHTVSAELPGGAWSHVRLSADGARVVAMHGQAEIYVVELATGKVIEHVAGKSRTFMGVALAGPHGDELIAAQNWWRGDVWIGKP